MPNAKEIAYIVSKNNADLKKVRIPGLNKPFEEMTIGELVQLRPGEGVEDAWEVKGVSENITAHTSSLLSKLAEAASQEAVHRQIVAANLTSASKVKIKTTF